MQSSPSPTEVPAPNSAPSQPSLRAQRPRSEAGQAAAGSPPKPLVLADEESEGDFGLGPSLSTLGQARIRRASHPTGMESARRAPQTNRTHACPLCAGPLVASESASYLRCARCSSRVSQVPPGTYGQEYYYHAPQFQQRLAHRGHLQVQHLRQLLKRAGAQAPRPRGTSLRLLELGCNSGYFVEAALAAGFEAYGVDVSSQAVAAGQERGLGSRLIAADARQPLPGPEAREFDLVAAWELLEHMDAPAEFLRTAAQHLAPGGLVIGSCPNAESAWLWALGAGWHGYDIPEYHRCYLTAAGFYAAAQAAGLEPLYCGSLNEPNGLFLLKNAATAYTRKLPHGPAQVARAALALALALPHWLLERAAGRIPGFEGETLLFAARKRA